MKYVHESNLYTKIRNKYKGHGEAIKKHKK